MSHFSRIIHDRMLPVLFEPSMIQNFSTFSLVWIFSRFLTNTKCLVNGRPVTALSPSTGQYCGLTVESSWSCMCSYTWYSIFIRLNAQEYSSCYCCRTWLFQILSFQDLCFKVFSKTQSVVLSNIWYLFRKYHFATCISVLVQ